MLRSTRSRAAVAAVLALPALAAAQQITLQKTNSISLSSNFFFSDETLMTPGSDYGNNPLSVAFDGTNAYVGGYHADTGTLASNKVGIVAVNNVLGTAPAVNPISGSVFALTQNTRGIDAITFGGGDLYFLHDQSIGGDFVRRMTTGGTTVWQVPPPDAQRIGAIAYDPVGDNGAPALGFVARGSGRLQELRLSDGAHLRTQSGGANPGPIYDPFPSTIGYSQRGMHIDATGNLAYSAANGVGVSLRTAGGTFTNLAGAAGTTRSIIKGTPVDNVGNGVAVLQNAGASGLKLLALAARVGGDATIGFAGSLTSSTGAVQSYDARFVQLRLLDGNTTGLVQTQLLGNEDGIGTQYTGEVKNFATATDASGNPVLLVVSFADRRLDVYQLEPTWTNPAGGAWDTTGNWFNNTRPDSGLQNALFGSAITSNAAVTVTSARTTKNLKFDNASASYALSGAAITIAAPGAFRGQITGVAGSHSATNAITLAADTDLRVNRVQDTLTLGVVSASAGQSLAKLGPGTGVAKAVRVNGLNVAAGTLRLLADGDLNDASRAATLSLANDGSGTFQAQLDLTNNGLIVTGTPIAEVEAALLAGRSGGSWTGQGLTSSSAAANSAVAGVGFASAGDIGATSFLGLPAGPTDTLLRYTRLGDANLSGATDIGDFSVLAANFNTAGKWSRGDFNYDGLVDIGDFSILAANFNQSAPASLPRGAAVPEPAALAVLAAALPLLRRRR